jgi:hypothetical protein
MLYINTHTHTHTHTNTHKCRLLILSSASLRVFAPSWTRAAHSSLACMISRRRRAKKRAGPVPQGFFDLDPCIYVYVQICILVCISIARAPSMIDRVLQWHVLVAGQQRATNVCVCVCVCVCSVPPGCEGARSQRPQR